ncbi:metal-sulfur cluster assembly factor [Ruania albidiflava]|uniref:metal-sulfur cluster assembly factor n=1 Tax=Ruania albidiflava TaxID=366586 RepID=UPI0003B69396|nr:metal-sulfur cluster assembly factor [Ruania albidiflava]
MSTTSDPLLPLAGWLTDGIGSEEVVGDLLREVIDPELGLNIVDLGLVYEVTVTDGTARVVMTLTTPGCPLSAYFEDTIAECLWGAPGVERVDLQIVWEPRWEPSMMSAAAKKALGW